MLSWTDSQWDVVLTLHQNVTPFNLRPLTTLIVSFLYTNFSISIGTAFIIQQYSILFIFFVSFSYYLKGLGFTKKNILIGLWILGFSYPILCLHFIPNFTWDDIWLYISLVWVLHFFVKEKYLISAVFLTFGALNREVIFIILPLLYLSRNKDNHKYSQMTLYIVPITLYLLYRLLAAPEIFPGRFSHFIDNFANLDKARQSIYSLIISFGYLWALFIFSTNLSGPQVSKICLHRAPFSL